MYFLFERFNIVFDIFNNLNDYKYNFKLYVINIFYNIINVFSKLQIYFIKFCKLINKLIDENDVLFNIKNRIQTSLKNKIQNVELIKDGVSYTEVINNFDFVIYSDNNDGNSDITNKVIIQNDINIPKNYKISNVKFIMVELIIGDRLSYILDFKNKHFNFYIVGNIFNLKFIEYYIKNIIKNEFTINNDERIILNILDENVNNIMVEIYPKTQSIILETNTYKIIN